MTPEQEAEILEAWQKMVNAGLSPDYYWLLSIVEDNKRLIYLKMTDYTLANVPFRILRPALNLLPTIVSSILTQVYVKDKDWEHRKLAAKIIALKDKTDALKNPSRRTTLVHLTSWYGLALELADAVQVTHPHFAVMLRNSTKEVDWLQPSWDYMREQMGKWVQDNGGASA